MDYAIIKSGRTSWLKVIKLTDWDTWEYDDFATVKSKEDNEIVWFNTEQEAIDFMFKHFDESLIDPTYVNLHDKTGRYYID